jgi:hypothetical protein
VRISIVHALTVAAATGLITASVARADEIRQVTSGQVTLGAGSAGNGEFSLVGDTFSVNGGLSEGNTPYGLVFPAVSGQSVDLTFKWGGSDIRTGVDTSGTVDGQTYKPLFLDGFLSFHGDPIVLPAAGPNGSQLTMTSPFTISSRETVLFGFDRSPVDPNATQLFRFGLSGGGTATITLSTFDGLFSHVGTVLAFSNASPTPEPASLLLVVTGLGTVGVLRRLRPRGGQLS